MNIVHNRYFDVVIHNDNSFCIVESASKPQRRGSALHTLQKIEKIVNDNLQYAPSGDIYSILHIEEIYRVLQSRTTEISDRYRKKIDGLNWFQKIFLWITGARKEFVAVDTTKTKIETRVSRTPMFPLFPEEIIQHIGSYLPTPDLLNWSSVNRHGTKCSNLAILNRAHEFGYNPAREFGYKGNNEVSKATEYIRHFLSELWGMRRHHDFSSFFNPENRETYSPGYSERIINNLKNIDVSTTFIPLLLKLYAGCFRNRTGFPRISDWPLYLIKSFLIRNYLKKAEISKKPLIQWNDALKKEAAQLLSYPVQAEDIDFVQILLKEGINPNTLDPDGCYPLDRAADDNNEEMVKILLRYGANVNAINNHESTALIAACRTCIINIEPHLALVKALLKHGADLTICTNSGTSSLHFAAIRGHTRIVEELIQHGAHVNQQDRWKNTPLMWACGREGSADTVRCLLSHGADPTLVSDDGETALAIAQEYNHQEIVDILTNNLLTWSNYKS